MGLFDKFKKKEVELEWKDMELVPGLNVGQYIKRIFTHNPKSQGTIYLNDLAIPYSYGNPGEIINASLLSNPVLAVQEAEDGDKKHFKIIF